MPLTCKPFARAVRTAARTAAFIPGASPPLVNIPIVLSLSAWNCGKMTHLQKKKGPGEPDPFKTNGYFQAA